MYLTHHSSVTMGMIIVIDQSCNNGRNIWNYSRGPYVQRQNIKYATVHVREQTQRCAEYTLYTTRMHRASSDAPCLPLHSPLIPPLPMPLPVCTVSTIYYHCPRKRCHAGSTWLLDTLLRHTASMACEYIVARPARGRSIRQVQCIVWRHEVLSMPTGVSAATPQTSHAKAHISNRRPAEA